MIKAINDTVHGENRTEQTSRQIPSDVANCEKLRLTPIPWLVCVQLPYHGNDNGQDKPNLIQTDEADLNMDVNTDKYDNFDLGSAKSIIQSSVARLFVPQHPTTTVEDDTCKWHN